MMNIKNMILRACSKSIFPKISILNSNIGAKRLTPFSDSWNADPLYIYKEVVTPSEFLKIQKENQRNILSTQVLPPRIGKDNDFGLIEVHYRDPINKNRFPRETCIDGKRW